MKGRHTPSRRELISAAGVGIAAAAILRPGHLWAAEPAVVETANGRVQGLSASGVVSFKGIPYAADTGGRNRFMAPRPVANWAGVREAIAFGPRAPQGGGGPPGAAGAQAPTATGENCCVLNVYTPDLNRNARRPVMFWIHGGGFQGGSGEVDGGNLARFGDVVVVAVNHRLNFFGYANLGHLHPDFVDSSAAGQLDLIAALNWVKTNIGGFGGDPQNVTVFGQSGGGAKIMTLKLMPRADGLFRRYINMSGSGTVSMKPLPEQQETIGEILKVLQVDGRDVRRLQELPAARILAAQQDVEDRLHRDQLRPVLDGPHIAHAPMSREGVAMMSRFPGILSATSTEAAGNVNSPANRAITAEQMKQRLKAQFGLDEAKAAAVYDGYRLDDPRRTPFDVLVTAASEARLRAPIRRATEAISDTRAQPVYLLDFNYAVGPLGAPHAADVAYAFGNQATGRNPNTSAPAAAVARNEMTAFVSFARGGAPTVPGVAQWARYDTTRRPVLVMEEEARLVDDFRSGDRRTSAMLPPQSNHQVSGGPLQAMS